MAGIGAKYVASFVHGMQRVKDGAKSKAFYCDLLGMTCVNEYKFDTFSLIFLESFTGAKVPEEGGKYVTTVGPAKLELTYNYGNENNPDFKMDNLDGKPNQGYKGLTFVCLDLPSLVETLKKAGVPLETRNKNQYATDPDGYKVMLLPAPGQLKSPPALRNTLQALHIRVTDLDRTEKFYTENLAMRTFAREAFEDDGKKGTILRMYSSLPAVSPDTQLVDKNTGLPVFVLEFSQVDSEKTGSDFKYHNGNDQPQAYGHSAFLVSDLEGCCTELEAAGVQFKKRPSEGMMKTIAFIYDPDNYWIELVQLSKS